MLHTGSEPIGRVKRRRPLGIWRFEIEGLDQRTRRGRRLKAILKGLLAEYSEANPHALRELAQHRLALEDAQSDVLNFRPSAREDAVRISNVIARIERELRAGIRQKAAAPSTTLAEYLRQNYPREAPAAAPGEAADGHLEGADAEAAV